VQVIQPLWQREDKIFPGQHVLSVASIYGVAGEYRRIAKIFPVVLTVPTSSIDSAKPTNTDACSPRQGSVSFNDVAYDLVSRNQIGDSLGKFAFDYVQVRPTNAAGMHSQ
jgi:hypothetical protein